MHGSKKSSTFAPAFEKKPESVAQQVEHIPFKDGVLGSSPSWFTQRRATLSFLLYIGFFSVAYLFLFVLSASQEAEKPLLGLGD